MDKQTNKQTEPKEIKLDTLLMIKNVYWSFSRVYGSVKNLKPLKKLFSKNEDSIRNWKMHFLVS